MRLTESFETDARPDQVLAALADPAYHAQRGARRGATISAPEISLGDELTVRLRWELPTEGLDPMARALVGPRLVLHEEQRWRHEGDGAGGHLRVRVEGLQVELDAVSTLEPAAKGATCRTEGALTARVPFMGSQVERQAAPVVIGFLRDEAAGLGEWARAH